MAIKGSLKEASLADVLQLLALGQKSGCLSVADRSNFGYIYFERGRICYASIVNRRDRIGDMLMKAGKVTQEHLETAITRQEQTREKRVGELLVEQGVISRGELEDCMRQQIEEAVFYLFTWTQGSFNFETDVRPERQDFLVSINPESLLLEGARRIDEWSLIEKKVPSFDLIFTPDKERLAASDVQLTDEQQQILALVDGARDVARLVEDSGLGEFEVGKALYGLITAGFAHRSGRSQQAKPGPVGEARIQEHRNLGIAFFKTGMLEEAAREFRRVAELRPADGAAYFHLGLVALRQAQWQEAAEQFKHAGEKLGPRPAVLHNLAFSYEQAGRLDEAEAAYGEAASRSRNDPRVMMGWGVVALERGEPTVAVARLDRARAIAGSRPLPPLWYWGRALASAAQDLFDDAEQVLREGIKLYPRNAVLRNNLAALLEVLGQNDQAEDVLRGALIDEPSLPQLSKNLGDVLYRRGNYDEAWEAYQRAVKLQPQLGDDVYFKLGNIAYRRRDRELARSFWRTALELNPHHDLARANLETIRAV